ncbi:GNAT family N-acetyltransferase [Streptomyces sp. CAU 1734]|uniref:GNAT family N-acetyltransferase n=1 Tax=Streptomyces sp. CAU 1734 TaxID=3140360 RepID=UPI00326016AB
MDTVPAGTITTGRLDPVPLRAADAGEMFPVLSDPAPRTFTGGTPDPLPEPRARYLRMTAGSPDPAVTWLNWVIRLRAESRAAGTVQATIGPSGDGPAAEIAWVVGTPWQRRGIATEAARALVDWLGRHSVAAVVAHVHPGHRASAAVAAAAGLRPTGEWHDGELRRRGRLPRTAPGTGGPAVSAGPGPADGARSVSSPPPPASRE